jgi:phosphoribosylformylglycinamidine cyclo-ligase
LEQNHIDYRIILCLKENNDAIFSIIKSLVKLCRKYKIAITSGETAILNTIKGLEIGITMVGKVKRNEIIEPNIQVGDRLIGLASSGIHSNGITLARKILDGNEKEIVKPTEIYVVAVNEVLKNHRKDVHGMVHVTGGAFNKLKDVMNKEVNIKIERNHNLKPQEIFRILKRGNLSDEEMYKTFNNGIGFIIVVDEKVANDILNILRKKHNSDIIGHVEKGNGLIKIESEFSNRTILL